jgi:hypothetical protein
VNKYLNITHTYEYLFSVPLHFYILFLFLTKLLCFGLSITEETLLVENRIWCIKIGIVLVLHFNPWVESSAGGQKVPEDLYNPVDMNRTVKKQVYFIDASQNEGLISLMYSSIA